MQTYRDNLLRELIIDNFAGGGGASVGIELALGVPVDIAVNHKKIRGLSWVVLRWAMSSVAPRVIFMENVPEIKTWCPLIEIDGQTRPDPAREGETFNGFVAMLTGGIEKEHPAFLEACEFLKIEPDSEDGDRLAAGLGYAVSWKEMKACDYGAPTIRNRFYLIARRDGQPIVFPEPTHGKGRKPYRTAAECIDWLLPCPSIFGRKKELAENTLRRIARGLDKFVIRNPKPFIVPVGYGERLNQQPRVNDINTPLSTIVSTCKQGLCTPSLIQYHTEQSKGEVRGQKMDDAIMTVDGSNRYAINAAFLSKYFVFILTEDFLQNFSEDR